MNMKWYGLILALLLCFSPAAQALQCAVEYRAMKTAEVDTWYGTVKKPQYKTGVVSGQGSNRNRCEQNALRSLKRDNWKITYSKIIKTTKQ